MVRREFRSDVGFAKRETEGTRAVCVGRRVGLLSRHVVLRLERPVLFGPGLVENPQSRELPQEDGRTRHGLDEHLSVVGRDGSENALRGAFELAQGSERAVDREDHVFRRQGFALVKFHVLADREEEPFGDALVLRRKRWLDLHLFVVAHETLVNRRASGGIEGFVLGVDVEGEKVPGARPTEVGGRCGVKAREDRGGEERLEGAAEDIGSVRHIMDLGLCSETPRNRRFGLIQENPRSAGPSLKKFSVSLRQHCARHPLEVQAAPPAAQAGVESGAGVCRHHAFDYTGLTRSAP